VELLVDELIMPFATRDGSQCSNPVVVVDLFSANTRHRKSGFGFMHDLDKLFIGKSLVRHRFLSI
jgi:hypothetical protein